EGFTLLMLSSAAVAVLSALFGPFIIVPALAATNTMFFVMSIDRPGRRVVIAVSTLAVVVPVLLEQIGVIPPSYAFRGGLLEVLPRAVELPALETTVTLLLVSIALCVVPGLAVGKLRDRLSAAERRLYMQAWNLRRIVPSAAVWA